ncbi:hypothetical protein [Halorubrum lipolyticum]|uniref:Uncharacterized protein n=1 Tax=Halorubrum lipolyticum DSM 21995 TaxID=1227482 RepID=M0NR62_9EURY|nr:hypothetical protein [Halorubrum lipolyticum]EMA59704.1 hypothetical protein C469_10291 [Halorubrum lipolyticum DSM 21995]
MSTDTDDNSPERPRDQSGSAGSSLASILGPLRGSYALQTAAVGAVVTVIAFIVNTGIWPAILGVWGIALALVGVTIHVVVTISQRGNLG